MPACTMTYPQDNQANPHNQLKSELPSKMTTCATLTRQDSEAHQANEQLKTKLPPVPDLDNRRYCRACQCTLPLSAFPSGTRRFLCKRHIWQRIQQPSKRRTNNSKRKLWTLWKKCWTDAKKTFKHDRILLLQRDIQETLAQLEDSSNGGQEASRQGLIRDSTAEVHATSDSNTSTVTPDAQPTSDSNTSTVTPDAQPTSDSNTSTVTPDMQLTSDRNPPSPPDVQITVQRDSEWCKWDIAIMPSNPEHPLSRDNVVVVDETARRMLLKAFREGGAVNYVNELGAMD